MSICVSTQGSFQRPCGPLRGSARQARGALAGLQHLQHLKKLVGLRQWVPAPILLAELQQSSMPDIWLLRAARFWKDLATSSGMRVALDAVREVQ